MPQVPVSERETRLNGAPLPYQHLYMDQNTFGAAQAQSLASIGQGLKGLANVALQIQETRDEAKLVEATNQLDKWQQDNLYDKDNGYYYKVGKDASGQTENVMKSFDDFVTEYKSQNRMSKQSQIRLNDIINKRRDRIFHDVNAHDYKQTGVWAKTEGDKGVENAIQGMVQSRNNPEERNVYIANGLKVIEWQGEVAHLDSDTVDAMKKEFLSKGHEATLNTLIQEGSLSAREYFEENKNDIDSSKHARFIGAIKNEEDKYAARGLADEIYAMYPNSPEQAYKELEKRKGDMDIDVYDNTEHRLSAKYSQAKRLEQLHDDEVTKSIYNQIDSKLSNGEIITEDDVNLSAIRDPRERMAMRNYINNLNSTGDTDTKYYVLDELNEMSMNDAQNFRKINLDKYRPYLSSSDLKTLKNRQNQIMNMTPTQIQDDNQILKSAIEEFHLTGNTGHFGKGNISNTFINSAKSYVREYELKHGKTLSGPQLKNVIYEFAKTMKYKDADAKQKANMYELYAEGMNKQAGFTRDVLADWENAAKAKGSPLTDEEKYKLVNKRVAKIVNADNRSIADALSQAENNMYAPKVGDIWQGHRITSLYGKRVAPKTGATTNHKGIDLDYKNNEPFKAYASGNVVYVGNDEKLGRYVDIQASDGTIHRYGHANRINVRKGQYVHAGDFIGLAGATGVATGPHVHYAKIVNGKFVNPFGDRITSTKTSNNNSGWAF